MVFITIWCITIENIDDYENIHSAYSFYLTIDYHLPLHEIWKFHMRAIVIKSAFEEDGKSHPQIFLKFCHILPFITFYNIYKEYQ